MVSKNIINKSLEDAILKCKPKFETMRTVKQIAKYFHLKYEGVFDSKEIDDEIEDIKNLEGKFHYFIDSENDDCRIYIPDKLLDKQGNLSDGWYEEEYLPNLDYYEENMSEEEFNESYDDTHYPLKELIKDYMDIPFNIKSSIGQIIVNPTDKGSIAGTANLMMFDGKGTINLYYPHLGINMRKTLYHEVGHTFSHKISVDENYWSYTFNYLADKQEYKQGRKEDRKLNGDRYATEYASRSKDFNEEQADVCSAMLLKATSKNDPLYSKRVMNLSKYTKINDNDYSDIISIDGFLARYPNRVNALNKYMELDLNG